MKKHIVIFAAVAAGLLVSLDTHAATFVYDPTANGNVLPSAPWTVDPGPSALDSQSVSGNVLTLFNEHTSPRNRGYIYYREGASVQALPLSSASDYEIRARVRVGTDVVGSAIGDRPTFMARVIDGSKYVALGAAWNHSTSMYNFYFVDTGDFPHPYPTRYAQASPGAPDGFFHVLLRKQGSTVHLFVDDGATPKLSLAYSSFPTFTGAYQMMWGQISSDATGTAFLNGISFGINEAAPPVPEPAAVALLAVAALTLTRRPKSHVSR